MGHQGRGQVIKVEGVNNKESHQSRGWAIEVRAGDIKVGGGSSR